MLVSEFTKAIERIIPLGAIGFEKDAVGMQVGLPRETKVQKILCCYEVTREIIREARERGANLIVAFHPLIFPSLSRVTDDTRTGALVRDLVRSEIGLYVQHTAFDAHPKYGTSKLMAEVLQLEDVRPLAPLKNILNKITVFVPHASARLVSEALANAGAGTIGEYDECSFSVEGTGTFRGSEASTPSVGEKMIRESVAEVRLEMVCEKWNTSRAVRAMIEAHPYEEVSYDVMPLLTDSVNYGMGAIGRLPEPMAREQFLQHVKEAFGTPVLRVSASEQQTVERVAMLGGAGMEFYGAAVANRAQAFITADVRYHDFYRAEHDGMLLVDAGHAETERFVAQGMGRVVSLAVQQLGGNASEVVHVSLHKPNAVSYFIS